MDKQLRVAAVNRLRHACREGKGGVSGCLTMGGGVKHYGWILDATS
jgi:hypothetical protein